MFEFEMKDFVRKIEHQLPKQPPKDETKCKCWQGKKCQMICGYCGQRNSWNVNEGLCTIEEEI